MAEVVLKFIAGRQEGREFPLKTDGEVTIGRDDEADLLIAEETVSRIHARLVIKNDEIVIHDNSKNGTYVNGRPILNVVLKPGDQIHIGRTILKLVVYADPPAPNWLPSTLRTLAQPATAAVGVLPFGPRPQPVAIAAPAPVPANPLPRPAPAPVGTSTTEHFRGSIADIALTDLVQLLTTTRKTGALVLRSRDMIGRIYFEKGKICHASMDDADTVNALKVFYRLMRWSDGTFELAPADGQTVPATIAETTDYLLLEAMHQLDEINNLGQDLPPLHAEIVLVQSLPAPLRDLAPGDLDFIQLVLHHKTVRSILDHYAGTDFEGYVHLKGLLARRYFAVAES